MIDKIKGRPVSECIKANRFNEITCFGNEKKNLMHSCDQMITTKYLERANEYRKTPQYVIDAVRCLSKRSAELKNCSCHWDGKNPIILPKEQKRKIEYKEPKVKSRLGETITL